MRHLASITEPQHDAGSMHACPVSYAQGCGSRCAVGVLAWVSALASHTHTHTHTRTQQPLWQRKSPLDSNSPTPASTSLELPAQLSYSKPCLILPPSTGQASAPKYPGKAKELCRIQVKNGCRSHECMCDWTHGAHLSPAYLLCVLSFELSHKCKKRLGTVGNDDN